MYLVLNFQMRPSLAFLTSCANGIGARLICEIPARHEHHFRDPQARPSPSERCPLGREAPVQEIVLTGAAASLWLYSSFGDDRAPSLDVSGNAGAERIGGVRFGVHSLRRQGRF